MDIYNATSTIVITQETAIWTIGYTILFLLLFLWIIYFIWPNKNKNLIN
jgi:hypothetical protein